MTRLRPFWRDALALLFALGDRRTPASARLAAVLALAYALSPLDLLPDAVPVLGLGDDLLIVPTILALAARTLPAPVLLSARTRSAAAQRRLLAMAVAADGPGPAGGRGAAGLGAVAGACWRRVSMSLQNPANLLAQFPDEA